MLLVLISYKNIKSSRTLNSENTAHTNRSRWYLVLISVSLDSSSMRENEIMCNNIRLGGRVPPSRTIGASAWCELAIIISQSSYNPRLIESHPVLYSVSKCFETELRIVCKVLPIRVLSIKNVIFLI